jgi:hypothetical protein
MKGRVADFWRCGEKERKEWGEGEAIASHRHQRYNNKRIHAISC